MAIRLAAVDVAPEPYAVIRYAATVQLYRVTVNFRSAQALSSHRTWVDLDSRLPARFPVLSVPESGLSEFAMTGSILLPECDLRLYDRWGLRRRLAVAYCPPLAGPFDWAFEAEVRKALCSLPGETAELRALTDKLEGMGMNVAALRAALDDVAAF
jgi:hypothetical protein